MDVSRYLTAITLATLGLLSSCGGDSNSQEDSPPQSSIGGSVTGLPGDGSNSVVLQNLGKDDLIMSTDGDFTFLTLLPEGSPFEVSVLTQPVSRRCEFENYQTVTSGVTTGPSVTNVQLTCYQHAQVITFAGSTSGFADGQGSEARFYSPRGVDIDSDGNLYVADQTNHRIRKISPDGTVSTLAGAGDSSYGYVEGTGAAAKFYSPHDVAVDSDKNVYVADTGNHSIRKITPAGVVSTLAGTGTGGYVDSTDGAPQFSSPSGIAVDSSNNLYVADRSNNAIRKVSPAGLVSTLAGASDGSSGYVDDTGSLARFWAPNGVALDSDGNIFVTDMLNQRIRKISAAGAVTTLAGNGNAGHVDGDGASSEFNVPEGIEVAANGNVYVADYQNNSIRKITPTGQVSTLAGDGTRGLKNDIGTSAQLNHPFGVTVDVNGSVYVGDMSNHTIRKIYQIE